MDREGVCEKTKTLCVLCGGDMTPGGYGAEGVYFRLLVCVDCKHSDAEEIPRRTTADMRVDLA